MQYILLFVICFLTRIFEKRKQGGQKHFYSNGSMKSESPYFREVRVSRYCVYTQRED